MFLSEIFWNLFGLLLLRFYFLFLFLFLFLFCFNWFFGTRPHERNEFRMWPRAALLFSLHWWRHAPRCTAIFNWAPTTHSVNNLFTIEINWIQPLWLINSIHPNIYIIESTPSPNKFWSKMKTILNQIWYSIIPQTYIWR